jgi:hypothetical protein
VTAAARWHAVQLAAQQRRRAEIARWLERLEQLRAVTPRSADEAQAQALAIRRHLAAAPGDVR